LETIDMSDPGKPQLPIGDPGSYALPAALLCAALLIFVVVFAQPEIEPRQWPSAGQWECTR
jgi:hypothetical protein